MTVPSTPADSLAVHRSDGLATTGPTGPTSPTSPTGPTGPTGVAVAFRAALRQLASPVVVITAATMHERRGITVSSFAPVSHVPPMISFCLRQDSRMLALLASTSHFAAHVFAVGDIDVLRRFASRGLSGEQQFASLGVERDEHGTPLLSHAVVVLTARIHVCVPTGDHSIVVGEVHSVRSGHGDSPLVHFGHAYRELGAIHPMRRE